MKPPVQSARVAEKSSWLPVMIIFLSLVTVVQCQFANEVAEKPNDFPKWNTFIPLKEISSLTGSVRIRLEPHGSIRAKVYANGQEQFETILDQEKPQHLLTGNIPKARVHLLKFKHNDYIHIVGMVIDDLTTQKRYVFEYNSPGRQEREQLKALPAFGNKTISIRGYAGSFTQDQVRFEDPL